MQSACYRLSAGGYDFKGETIPGEIERMRKREEIMSKSAQKIIPAGHIQIKENVLKMDNLAGVSESKALWAKDLHLPREAEYTFFAACGYQHMNYLQGST